MVKSQILQTCLQSLYTLPPTEMLRSSLPPLDLAPDVTVTACPRLWVLGSGYRAGLPSPGRVCERGEHRRELARPGFLPGFATGWS